MSLLFQISNVQCVQDDITSHSWDVFIFNLLRYWLIWILPIIEYVIVVDGLSAAWRNYLVFYWINFACTSRFCCFCSTPILIMDIFWFAVRLCLFCLQVFCEVEMKRMCLSQANADLAEAAEKLEAIRKKLAVSLLRSPFFF